MQRINSSHMSNTDKTDPALIALDWGTTSLRAYVLNSTGNVLEKKSAPLGILKIPDNNFDAAFEEICASWLDNGLAGWPSSLLNFVHLFGHLFRRRRSYL